MYSELIHTFILLNVADVAKPMISATNMWKNVMICVLGIVLAPSSRPIHMEHSHNVVSIAHDSINNSNHVDQ